MDVMERDMEAEAEAGGLLLKLQCLTVLQWAFPSPHLPSQGRTSCSRRSSEMNSIEILALKRHLQELLLLRDVITRRRRRRRRSLACPFFGLNRRVDDGAR